MDASAPNSPAGNDTLKKRWALPWYGTAALLIGLCILFSVYLEVSFQAKKIAGGGIIEFLFVPSILLATSAILAAIIWFVTSKVKKPVRIAYSPFWVGSLVAVIAVLIPVFQYQKAQDEETERKDIASQVSAADLSSIELFDGGLRWMADFSGKKSDTIKTVEGRVRNGLARPLRAVTVRVVIQNAGGKAIETFNFEVPLMLTPLPSGDVRGFSSQELIDRVPEDMKWSWRIVAAKYALE